MKKILFIIYTYSHGGGAEKILTNIVNGLAKKTDYEISILEYANMHVKEEIIDPKIKRLKPVVDMKSSSRPVRILKYLLVHLCPILLRKIYIKEKYDVEISFNYQIPSFLSSGKKSVYNIQWNHGDIYGLKNQPFRRFLQNISFRKADRIVAISQNTKNSIVELFPKYQNKVRIIYNGTDIDAILEKAALSADISLKPNSLIFLGRLEESKDPMTLIEYTEKMIREGFDLNLYLLGTGVQEEEISCRIKNAKLEDRIHMLGYINNPSPLMKQASAVCMFSKREGFPTVFTEGLALGKPFISTQVGGVEELSNDGKCGIVVSSYEEFKKAVKKVVFDQENSKKMSLDCKEHIRSFSYDRQIEQTIELIEEKA